MVDDPLTSMKSFHCTKALYWEKKFLHTINSIHIYLCSAFHNIYRFNAALQKIHVSTLQFRVICYQGTMSKLCISEIDEAEKEKYIFMFYNLLI